VRVQLIILVVGAAAAGSLRPAAAAELKVVAPADRAIVAGSLDFKVKTVLAPGEEFLMAPEIAIKDEYGDELDKTRALYNKDTDVFAIPFDTRKLKDGMYLATVTYRYLVKGKPQEEREDLTLAFRNRKSSPKRFTVTSEQVEAAAGGQVDMKVRVYDAQGHLMPGARVALKVDKGEVGNAAEITDGNGEATVSVFSDDPQQVTLTVTVESLPSVTRAIAFK
jgi:hypothetical protein